MCSVAVIVLLIEICNKQQKIFQGVKKNENQSNQLGQEGRNCICEGENTVASWKGHGYCFCFLCRLLLPLKGSLDIFAKLGDLKVKGALMVSFLSK